MNSYETTPAGIDLRLRELAQATLGAAGLRILDTSRVEELLDSSRQPVLRITLLALPVKSAGRQTGNAYSLAVQLTETGRVPASQAEARVELWQSARLNVTSADRTRLEIERDLGELLEQLLADWRLANRST